MNVIITGATGMVGMGVLLECLDHPSVDQVLTIGRSRVDLEHAKLRQIEHADFSNFAPIADQLTGYDAAYLCMGVSSAGMDEADYTRITYEYTLSLARVLVDKNAGITCTYVSGQGTDGSESSRSMWPRVKGRTENALLKLGFKQAYMFRPGVIIPLRGITSRTKMYQFFYDYFMWLIRLIKAVSPNSVVNTTQLGLAMINVTRFGYDRNIIDPRDIILLAKAESN